MSIATLRTTLCAAALAAGLASSGCVAQGRIGARAYVTAPAPSLVYVGPGIWVMAEYDEPVFYSDGLYWRWDSGVWYRSSVYTGSWVRVEATTVPVRIRTIDRPRAYVYYKAPKGAKVRQAPGPARSNARPEKGHPENGDRGKHRGHGKQARGD